MLRGMLGLLSLLIIGVGAAYYFAELQAPVAETGQYQKIESQAQHAAALMQHDPQAEVDAANGNAPPATNAPSAGN